MVWIRYTLSALFVIGLVATSDVIDDAYGQITFSVNTTSDESDTSAGDGTCDTGIDPPGPATVGCTLRAAIEEANALAGADTVEFSIVTQSHPDCGSIPNGTCTISPGSALPAITDTFFIDGETQFNATCGANFSSRDLRIVLDGSSVANDGLRLQADESVVRGLVISNFSDNGIDIHSSNTRVSCNYIGTDVTGMVDVGNGGHGVNTDQGLGPPGDGLVVGTNSDGVDDEEEWNLISGNGGDGIRSNTENTTISGNLIGVNAAISATLGNDANGVYLKRQGLVGVHGDGVADLFERNVIGGSGEMGILTDVHQNSADVHVRGNYIGTDTTATLDLGNTLDGLGATTYGGEVGSNLDDSFDESEGNVIAFNGGNGIVSFDGGLFPTAFHISMNSIFSNGGLGIDLGNDGAGANDAGDEDSQGARQNYPELQSAVAATGELHVRYLVDTDTVWLTNSWPLRVEFFKADADQQEGRSYLGFDLYDKADWHSCGSPPCVVNVNLTTGLTVGDTLVATATGFTTSEFSPAFPISAVSLVVNGTSDAPDLTPGDGLCDSGVPNDLINCSLRAAIEEANALAGPDTIRFLINAALAPPNFCDPGTGLCAIAPDSALPTITETVAILGTTQPGAACGAAFAIRPLKIILNGPDAGVDVNGLTLESGASGSFISGLNIQGFDGNGIELDGANDVHIACNNIGTNFSGTAASANGQAGISIESGSNGNTIGTNGDGVSDAAEWNVISGNGTLGVRIFDSDNNVIARNLVGLGANGVTPVGNGGIGIQIRGVGNRVGTDGDGISDPLEFNVVVANGSHGVNVIGAASADNWIAGNYIGTNLGLLSGLGNVDDGVRFGADAAVGVVGTNLDGSGDDLEGNTIAFNGGAGVALLDANNTGIAIRGNAIFSNVGLGIDLNDDGATTNDVGDADVNGANGLQNYPDVASAEVNGDNLSVTYTVDSEPANSQYPLTVEFFIADGDQEEGQTFVARDTFSVSDWSTCGPTPCDKILVLAAPGVVAGDTLVATTTDSLGNTSEFSVPVEAVDGSTPAEGIALHVKAFLEGPYGGGMMSTTLNDDGDLPLSQPFSAAAYDGTVLNYDSVQTVDALPDSTVDWVLVNLRTGTGPETAIAGTEFAALVFEGGTVTSTGEDSLHFPSLGDGTYYLVLRSRNHLDVMSSSAVSVSDGTGSWDFTTASTQAFGASPMKNLGDDSWGLYAGDGSVDGHITAPDFNIWNAATTAGATGYEPSDHNLDGHVTAPDFNLWNANTTSGAASKVPN